jgi:hypothetical protein
MRPLAVSSLALGLIACSYAPPERFRPTDPSPVAEVSEQLLAADYPLRIEGRAAGEVRVYSKGAFRDARRRTMVHVGFDIRNREAHAMRLAPTVSARLRTDEGPIVALAPHDRAADLTVPPGSSRKFDVLFELPKHVQPQNVDAFSVSWTLDGEGLHYAQATSFVERQTIRRVSDEPFNAPMEPYDGEGYPYRNYAPHLPSTGEGF